MYFRLPHPVRVGVTFVLVLFSWVLFRCPTLDGAIHYFGAMFGLVGASGGSVLLGAEIFTRGFVPVMAVCAILAFQRVRAFDWVDSISWPKAAFLVPLFLIALGIMFAQSFNPFLYFQF